jgi:hypothetical protein
MEDDLFLPGLPVNLIRAAYLAAPGDEIGSGKFANPQSSAALVANAFGLFLNRPALLPPLPGTLDFGWPAQSVGLEAIVRFPWSGGRHPCLDVLIVTGDTLIGVESKRFEPFRPKTADAMSDAYWRPVWGEEMTAYERCRDGLRDGSRKFVRLDAAQLIKHAFALRTAVHSVPEWAGKRPILYYLYAEPEQWPEEKRSIPQQDRTQHRDDIGAFSKTVVGDEVLFRFCSYAVLLAQWAAQSNEPLRAHASAIIRRFVI